MTEKKIYAAPAVKSELLKIGVFGSYGGGPLVPPIPWKRRRRRKNW
jgi:hypothetical protein